MSVKPYKLLFVEDEPDDYEIVRLELLGLATVCHADTRDKVVAALKEQWDCLLIDLKMYEISGEEAIAMAKAACPTTPILVVTGSVDDEMASLACQKGAVDYVRKDRLRRLRQAVTNAIRNAEIERENEERKSRENRNQRLELLGEMVVGLSHDLRNVLSVILAGVEIIRPKIPATEQRIADVINSSVRRAEDMLAQLLAFGRGDAGEPRKVSTEHVVGEVATLLRSGTFPKNIKVEITTAIGTAALQCDESQINRALWNLVVNARDSMPNGGQLVVSAQNVEQDGNLYVCITIKDSGHGIPDAIKDRIFEPFFTTKGGKGTGLGLSLTQHIIAAHGGKIDVQSSTGGTEFSVYLPQAGKTHNQAAPDFDGQGKTVLLVEDEEFLRSWAKLRLENANYKVIDASNGAVAMQLFLENMEQVDVLVTDIHLLTMMGDHLAKTLRELKPGLKLIYISGRDPTGDYNPAPSVLLAKPFASVKLLKALEDVLA